MFARFIFWVDYDKHVFFFSFTDAHRALRARHVNEKLEIVAKSPKRSVPRDDNGSLPALETEYDVRYGEI